MKIFKSTYFVDFSLGKNFTLAEVQSSYEAAKANINAQLKEANVNMAKTARSEMIDYEVNKKQIVVKVIENQEESFEVFSSQYAYSH